MKNLRTIYSHSDYIANYELHTRARAYDFITMTSNGKLFLWASGNRVRIKRFCLTETIRTIDGAPQLNVVGAWSGSTVLGLSKSSGNTVNRIIIFGVPECVYIDIEMSTVDDDIQGKRLPLPAKTCILACESANYSHENVCVCLHSPALHSMQMEFCAKFSRLHLSSHNEQNVDVSLHVDSTSEAAHLLLHGSYNSAFHNFIRFDERRWRWQWWYVCAFDFSARVH